MDLNYNIGKWIDEFLAKGEKQDSRHIDEFTNTSYSKQLWIKTAFALLKYCCEYVKNNQANCYVCLVIYINESERIIPYPKQLSSRLFLNRQTPPEIFLSNVPFQQSWELEQCMFLPEISQTYDMPIYGDIIIEDVVRRSLAFFPNMNIASNSASHRAIMGDTKSFELADWTSEFVSQELSYCRCTIDRLFDCDCAFDDLLDRSIALFCKCGKFLDCYHRSPYIILSMELKPTTRWRPFPKKLSSKMIYKSNSPELYLCNDNPSNCFICNNVHYLSELSSKYGIKVYGARLLEDKSHRFLFFIHKIGG